MPNGQWLTVWFLALSLVTAGIYDLWAGWSYGRDATVSAVITQISRDWPIVPLAIGILIGHLFWPQ